LAGKKSLVKRELIEQRILLVRGSRVMIDADLAEIYGTTTKRLNQAVKRNRERFPVDFMFQLNEKEKIELVTECDHLSKLKYSPSLPYAFTEHGAIMAANVLNTPQAVEMSVFVVRAFIRLRQMVIEHKDLARKLSRMEQKYDAQFKIVFDEIKKLMIYKEKPRRRIGFVTDQTDKGKK